MLCLFEGIYIMLKCVHGFKFFFEFHLLMFYSIGHLNGWWLNERFLWISSTYFRFKNYSSLNFDLNLFKVFLSIQFNQINPSHPNLNTINNKFEREREHDMRISGRSTSLHWFNKASSSHFFDAISSGDSLTDTSAKPFINHLSVE